MLRFERMLFGSLSAAALYGPPGVPVTAPGCVGVVVAPGVVAGAAGVGTPSSTGFSSVLLQPAMSAMTNATMIHLRMILSPRVVGSARQRTPGGFAHIGGRRDEPLFYATVGGYAGQYTTRPLLGRVDDELRIRCDARTFVERPGRERLHLPSRVLLNGDHETAAVAAHENEALAVGQCARRDVPVAFECHSL